MTAQLDLITIAPTEIELKTLIDQQKPQFQKVLQVVKINLNKERVLLEVKKQSLSVMMVKLNPLEIKCLQNNMNHPHHLLKKLSNLIVNGINPKMVPNVSLSKTLAMILLNQSQAWMTAQLDLIITAPTEIELKTLIDQQRPQFQKVLQVVKINLNKEKVPPVARKLSSSAMMVKLNLLEIKCLQINMNHPHHLHKSNSLLLVNGTSLKMELIALPSKAHVWKDQGLRSQFKQAAQSELLLNLIDLKKLQKSKHLKTVKVNLTKERVLLVAKRPSLLAMTDSLNLLEIKCQPINMNHHQVLCRKRMISGTLHVTGTSLKMEVNAFQDKQNAMSRTLRNQSWKIALIDKLHMMLTEMDLPILIEWPLHLQLLKRKKRRPRKRRKRRRKLKKLSLKNLEMMISGTHHATGT
jgi:hypothetical protein